MLAPDAGHRAQNLEQALQRLEMLFASKPPEQRAQDLAQSAAMIDHYLDNNHFSTPVPAEVRDAMIALDADINSVHQAMPYGRGNVLVQHAAGAEVDRERTLQKTSLMILAQRMAKTIPAGRCDAIERSVQHAAMGILTGAASCETYAYTLALVAARRCNQMGLGDYAQIEIYAAPKLAGGAARINHAYVAMTYTDEEEEVHRIVLDPWADKNRVMLEEHGLYRKAKLKEDGAHLEMVDHRIPGLIAAQMKHASDRFLETACNNQTDGATFSGMEDALRGHDPAQRYDVQHSLAGYVDATVDFAQAGVQGANARRPSVSAEERSPLISKP